MQQPDNVLIPLKELQKANFLLVIVHVHISLADLQDMHRNLNKFFQISRQNLGREKTALESYRIQKLQLEYHLYQQKLVKKKCRHMQKCALSMSERQI